MVVVRGIVVGGELVVVRGIVVGGELVVVRGIVVCGGLVGCVLSLPGAAAERVAMVVVNMTSSISGSSLISLSQEENPKIPMTTSAPNLKLVCEFFSLIGSGYW